MLGLVMCLVATSAPVSPAAGALPAAVTCGDRAESCDLAPPTAPPLHQEYATPAVIDCRSTSVPLVLSTLVGECTDTLHDLSYRTSRYPESEDSQSLAPAVSHERRRGVASCDGLPQKAPAPPLSESHPLAVYATPFIVTTRGAVLAWGAALELPSRFGDPPDRPPRV